MDKEKVSKFICERRKLLGFTQWELAIQLNISNKAVSRWETGESYPDITMISGLAKLLGVSTDELLVGEMKQSYNYIKTNENRSNNQYKVISHKDECTLISKDIGNKKTLRFVSIAFIAIAIFMMSCVTSIYSDRDKITSTNLSDLSIESKLNEKFNEKVNKDYSWKIYKVLKN